MAVFAYRAVHASGRVASGRMRAANENDLAHALRETGLELIDAKEKRETPYRLPTLAGASVPPRVLAGFCARMHDLLISGIAFIDALNDVTASTDNRLMRDTLTHIARAISNGGSIASSFASYPRLFSPVFLSIIAAGERSGDMAVTFDFLARHATNKAQTSERMLRALRYPAFLFLVAGGAAVFMLSMVVPQIIQFFSSIDSHLPLATRLLVALSDFFRSYGWALAVLLAVGCATVVAARKFFPAFALTHDAIILQLPGIGAVIAKTSLARFAHSFSLLFRSGCDVPACLQQAQSIISNRHLSAGIANARQSVQSGASLSQALDGALPPFAIGLLRTGERSGNLGKSLDDIASTYDREAQAATDNFIGLLEPCLTLAIGALLAWTVIAVLGPLYGSLSVLGGRL